MTNPTATITDSERKVLRSLMTNHYGDSSTWADCINESDEPSGIEGKALSGVVASLSKKGLVACRSGCGESDTVDILPAGIQAAS